MAFLLLMPSYNQAHYIAQAVDSILAQDDLDWELWVVDNSNDDTPRLMQQRYGGEPRIHFHHIPERMDPGQCLNWMLERTAGRGTMFSYVHTDNNLLPSYVRHMRAALEGDALALAYCDMKTIDGEGRHIAITRRGSFDFVRLLSLSPLGVPFSATTALAAKLGGFSADDVADDVRFCIEAFAHARFVHLPEPLIDYRLHSNSRTETSGGGSAGMYRAFLQTVAHATPALERAGLQPLGALAKAVERRLNDLDLAVEHWCYARRLEAEPWWRGVPNLDAVYRVGLMPDLRRLRRGLTGLVPPRSTTLRGFLGSGGPSWRAVWQWPRLRRRLREAILALGDVLPPWAFLVLNPRAGETPAVRLASADARTLVGAAILRERLGCALRGDAALMARAPAWLQLEKADGSEPLLDLSGAPRLG